MTINSSRNIVLHFSNGTFTIYEAGRARIDADGKIYGEYVLSKGDIYYLHNGKYFIWKANGDFESCIVYGGGEQKLGKMIYSIFSSKDYFMTSTEVEILNQKYKLGNIT